jgi:hypothetical protein
MGHPQHRQMLELKVNQSKEELLDQLDSIERSIASTRTAIAAGAKPSRQPIGQGGSNVDIAATRLYFAIEALEMFIGFEE